MKAKYFRNSLYFIFLFSFGFFFRFSGFFHLSFALVWAATKFGSIYVICVVLHYSFTLFPMRRRDFKTSCLFHWKLNSHLKTQINRYVRLIHIEFYDPRSLFSSVAVLMHELNRHPVRLSAVSISRPHDTKSQFRNSSDKMVEKSFQKFLCPLTLLQIHLLRISPNFRELPRGVTVMRYYLYYLIFIAQHITANALFSLSAYWRKM